MSYSAGPTQYSGSSTTQRPPQGRFVERIQQVYTATPGTAVFTLTSAATTNATNVKASNGNLLAILANNASASARWIRLYNKATAPTVGTDTPIVVIQIPASSSKEITLDPGVIFSNGIGIAITGAAALLDTTAVAANDVQVALSYV
jgi:hypothetical protein